MTEVSPKAYGTRREHLTWAKQRAVELLATSGCTEAYASFISDMNKLEACRVMLTEGAGHMLTNLGATYALNNDAPGLQNWIEGWN